MKFTKSITELKDEILNKHDQKGIYEKYIGSELRLGKAYRSPLRKDKKPSFNIYPKGQKILFNDFAGESGDVFEFVSQFFEIDFVQAVRKIAWDLGISDEESLPELRVNLRRTVIEPIKVSEKVLEYEKFHRYTPTDAEYWSQYGVSGTHLMDYNTWSVKWFRLSREDKMIYEGIYSTNDPIYVYEDIEKVYRPLHEDKSHKWISKLNAPPFGLVQLPSKADTIPIMAGEKDVLSLYANTGLRGISLNSEGQHIAPELFLKLREISDNVVTIYDQDMTGLKKAMGIQAEYGIPAVRLEKLITCHDWFNMEEVKDVSDYFRGIRKRRDKNHLTRLIKHELEQWKESKKA